MKHSWWKQSLERGKKQEIKEKREPILPVKKLSTEELPSIVTKNKIFSDENEESPIFKSKRSYEKRILEHTEEEDVRPKTELE